MQQLKTHKPIDSLGLVTDLQCLAHVGTLDVAQSSWPQIPARVLRLLEVLEQGVDSAWIVGGWVRDALLGRTSHDIDICCSALWQISAKRCRDAGFVALETGVQHGTITVYDPTDSERILIEITSYRIDGSYTDGRHPDAVQFTRDVRKDLARRDFTINAMAYHPVRGLLDVFGGREDLAAGIIRAVGEPTRRFEEDALRIIRAVRFAARYHFTPEKNTRSAMRDQAALLAQVARERVGQELLALIRSGEMGWALRSFPEVLAQVVPEVAQMQGFDQASVYHAYDVLEHTARVCDAVEAFSVGLASDELRFAALFHDIAKPATFSKDVAGHGHFFYHQQESALRAERYLTQFGIAKQQRRLCSVLIQEHDEPLPATRTAVRALLVRLAHTVGAEQAHGLAHQVVCIKKADALAKAPACRSYVIELEAIDALIDAERDLALTPQQLAVTGADLIACGIPKGPALGMYLAWLHSCVIEGSVANDRDALLELLS